MRSRWFVLVVLVGLLLAPLSVASAQSTEPLTPLTPPPSAENGQMTDETPQLWFVELPNAPTADGTALATVQKDKADFRAEARQVGLQYKERYAFDTLWNGVSIAAKPSELAKLSRMASVKTVYPVGTIAMPQPEATVSPDLFTALSMTGADIAHTELGLTGQGIKVAVMDTGIDYDHSYLGGDGVARSNSTVFPTTRVIKGYDLVGDAYNADPASPSYNETRTPDAYPDDCAGHGTHVAGIIGANGPNFTGVAPDVVFGSYRVFGCQGSTTDDVMIKAMEMALADGMQILNMSIGDAFTWPQSPTAQASDRLVNKGMVVVASIGNSGANGLYSAGAPGLGQKVIGVASFDNIGIALHYFTVSPDATKIGYTPAAASTLPPTSGTSPMARTGTQTSTADACAALPAGSLSGKVALIRRGTCSFYQKAWNAQTAGAIAVVLYNNVAGRVNPTVAGVPPITIPVVAVSNTEGVLIDNRLAAGPVDMTWTDQLSGFPNATGNLISSFSSYGLAPDLTLKPDIGAPGGFIYSTYPLELGGYASLSGTSMASPHTAGAVALLLQARPNTPAQAVRDILQNSAEPKPWWGNPALGFLDNVSRQGAGMLQIDKAIQATTKIQPGKLSLGESQAGPQTRTLNVENNADQAVTYNLTSVNALSVEGTFTPGFYLGDASVAFAAPTVTVPAHGSATVNVTITAATGPDKAQYGGYVVFTPQGGGQIYRVPFAGFVGDYQSIQTLVPTGNGFPWLAKLSGQSYVKQSAGASFTMAGADIPFVLIHLDHQSRLLRLEVVDAVSGKNWHRATQEEYLRRNSTSTAFFAYAFDGTTTAGNKTYTVPNGQYVLKLSVLKALGDSNNPADWETWTSPAFTIARP